MSTYFPGGPGSIQLSDINFEGVRLYPIVPFTPLVGQNAIEWNVPLITTGAYWSGSNPTRLSIPSSLPSDSIGVFAGNIAFTGGSATTALIMLRLNGTTLLEGDTNGSTASPGRLSFTTGPFAVIPGSDYYELIYEFGDVTGKTVQIIGTSLSFQYIGNNP